MLVLSNSHKEYILEDDLFAHLGKRMINFDNNCNLKDLINYLLLNLDEQTGKTIISKTELIDRSIKKKHEQLMKIDRLFNTTNNYDIPLINKYIVTGKSLNNNDTFYKYYRTFRIKKPFNNYSYTELKEACNKILFSKLSSVYIKYRRFIDNNIFNCLKYPLDYDLLNDSIAIIDNIINNQEIQYNLSLSKYTGDFMDAFIANEIVNDKCIISLSNLVNLKHNYELLNNNTKKKWINIFNKLNKTKGEYNLKLFDNLNKEICQEYTNNYNSIISLKDKLSFLKSILNENKYNEEMTNIIKNENVYDILSFYKKIFKTTYNNKITIDLVSKISKIEEDILKYCYDDLEEKKEIDELVSIIPLLKSYLDIEEEEIKHLDLINLYKEYDSIIDSIYYDSYKRCNLISKAINNVWDNKLRDGSALLKENIHYLSNEAINRFFPCVISNYSKNNLEELIYKKFTFEKIIIIDEENFKDTDFEKLNKLCKNIVYINIDTNIETFTPNINKDYRNYLNEVSVEILTEIENYLLIRYNNIEINIKETYIELEINDNKIFILLNTQYTNQEQINKDIFLNKYYKDNNINVYRLWNRDWWLNKTKELNKIEEYINKLTIEGK